MAGLVQRQALTMARFCLAVVFVVGASCINAKSPPDDPHNPYLPLAVLEAEEASRLRLPDAEVLRRVGGERFNNITGPQGSFTGAVYGTQATQAEVFAFYQRELTRRGWVADGTSTLSSGELPGGRGWCKPRMYFRLAIFDPQRYERTGITDGARFRTVFDARLQASELGCPYTPRPYSP